MAEGRKLANGQCFIWAYSHCCIRFHLPGPVDILRRGGELWLKAHGITHKDTCRHAVVHAYHKTFCTFHIIVLFRLTPKYWDLKHENLILTSLLKCVILSKVLPLHLSRLPYVETPNTPGGGSVNTELPQKILYPFSHHVPHR